MSQVITELVIDAQTQGAADFTRAMEGAEKAANSGVESVTGFNAGIAALSAGAVGAVAGVKVLLDYVVDANKSLSDMLTISTRVGLSLKEFQGIQFGGAVAGLNTSQINSGLEKSAALLNDASRNSNSLSKELEANHISIRQANGQLINENQLLTIAANLIRNARNPGDKDAIAQMLGFTKEWVPLLEQGGAAISGLADEAKKAGAVIDDETIKRADEFDKEWRKSSVEFSTYMKASLSALLPIVDDLILGAMRFIGAIDRNKVEKAANDALEQLRDATGTPEAGGLKIGITSETISAIDDFKNSSIFSLEFWSAAGRAFSSSVQIISPQDVKWFSGTDAVRDTSDLANQAGWAAQGNSWSKFNASVNSASSGFGGGKSSVVAAKDGGEGGDQVDRAINSLRRHTAQQEADTRAAGQGAGALARLRAEAAETAAVLANGGKETEKQAADFAALRQRAEEAAVALAKAKIAVDIKFNRDTAFLTQEDVQIAAQLKSIYPDVTVALNSTEAAQMRFNNSLKQMSSLGQEINRGFFVDFETGLRNGKSGFDALRDAGVNALGKIADKLASMAADNLWKSAFGGSSSGGLFSLFGGGGGGDLLAGSVSSGTGLGAGTGGLAFPMFADGTDSAPGGWAIVGERGPERVNLPQGSQVIPNGRWNSSNDNVSVRIGDTNLIVQGNADDKAVAQIRQELEQHKAELPSRVVEAMRQAKKHRLA